MIRDVVFTAKILNCASNPSEFRRILVYNLTFSRIIGDNLYRFALTSEDIQTVTVANHERTASRN